MSTAMEPRTADEERPTEPEDTAAPAEAEAAPDDAPEAAPDAAPAVVVGPKPGGGKRFLRALPWALFVLALAAAVVFAVAWRGAQDRKSVV